MSFNPRCLALNQITTLVQNVNKKNYKATCSEVSSLVERYGSEADRHLFRALLTVVEFSTDGKASAKDEHQIQLLMQEANSVTTKPNFVSILCFGFEKQTNKSLAPTPHMLQSVCKGLRLSPVQEVVVALGLTLSFNPDLKHLASNHLKTKLPDLLRAFSDHDPGQSVHDSGLNEVSAEVLHTLLLYLLQHSEQDLGLTRDTVEAFIGAIRQDFPRERVPVVLAPLLYQQETDITEDRLVSSVVTQASSTCVDLCDLFNELGYSSMLTKEVILQHFKDLDVTDIAPKTVARILGMMAATYNTLSDSVPLQAGPEEKLLQDPPPQPPTWNMEAFIDAIKTKYVNMNWREVVLEFDHPEFYLPEVEGLRMIMKAYKHATSDVFPVESLYRMWSNTRGQLSWIRHALSGCPEFSFADFPCKEVTVSTQRSLPEDESRNIRTWMSLDLIETLLNLAESGHFEEAHQLFGFPLKHCPDILLFGVLQSKPIWHTMQHELLCFLVPFFMANHPNSSAILHFAWQGAASDPSIVRQLMSNAIADWYLRSDSPPDHSKLSKILDVTQDLKALSILLNNAQFSFVMDLACLAAKREYLKLDKWISDKIREHQEPFIAACIAFLTRKAGNPIVPGTDSRTSLNRDIVRTILSCLQPVLSSLSAEWAEKLRALIQIHGPIPPKLSSVYKAGESPTFMTMPSMDPLVTTVSFSQQGNTPSSPFTAISGSPSKPTNPWSTDATDAPKLVGMSPGSGFQKQMILMQPQIPSDAWTETISKEAEEQANSYFQAVYHGKMTVDQLLTVLKQLRSSTVKKEREVFTCMLKNMFDEYRFFPQFPEKELQITGQLFGGIIDQGLVAFMRLGMALRNVLDALRKPPMTKMFLFGVAALDKFKTRLKEYPQYCEAIGNLQHFQQLPLPLQQYVQFARHAMVPLSSDSVSIEGSLPFGSPSGGGPQSPVTVNTGSPSQPGSGPASPQLSPGGGLGGLSGPTLVGMVSSRTPSGSPVSVKKSDPTPPMVNTPNIGTLLGAVDTTDTLSQPPDSLKERIHFIFNNLSTTNLSEKVS
jgi:CCR4-NOT transcription complex subunit 1